MYNKPQRKGWWYKEINPKTFHQNNNITGKLTLLLTKERTQ